MFWLKRFLKGYYSSTGMLLNPKSSELYDSGVAILFIS